MLQPALACAHGKAEVIARDIMAECRHELRVSSVAQDTDDRRQRQDEALYSRALESIDLNRSTLCSTLHQVHLAEASAEVSQQQSAAPPLNEPWERLCAHLCKQCHCIRSVTQQAFKHRLLWLYLPANACFACRPTLRGSQPLLSEAVLPVWPAEDALSARANSFSSDNSPK